MGPFGWRLAAIAFLFALGACAAQTRAPAAPSVQSTPPSGTVLPPAQGVTAVGVRAQITEGGVTRDVAARCDLASTYATARFTTPATISLPDLGSATPPVTVTCALDGRRGSAVAQPSVAVSQTGMSGWPAIGISIGAGGGSYGGTGVSVGGFWNGGAGDGRWTRVVYPDLLIPLR